MDSDRSEFSSSSFGIVGTRIHEQAYHVGTGMVTNRQTPREKQKQLSRTLQMDISKLRSDLEFKKTELSKLEAEIENEKIARRDDYQAMKEDNIRLTYELSEKERQLGKNKEYVKRLTDKVRDLEEHISKLEEQSTEQSDESQTDDICKKMNELALVMQKIMIKNGAIHPESNAELQANTVKELIEELTGATKSDNKLLKKENAKINAELTGLKSEMKDMNCNISEMKNAMQDLVNKITTKENRTNKKKTQRGKYESYYRV